MFVCLFVKPNIGIMLKGFGAISEGFGALLRNDLVVKLKGLAGGAAPSLQQKVVNLCTTQKVGERFNGKVLGTLQPVM
jgi:hypothetical protein